MDNKVYAGYLVLVIFGGALGALWNFFFMTEGFYHPYFSIVIGISAAFWFALNLGLIFVEGLEETPDARKIFLPVWFVIGTVLTFVYAAFEARNAPSWITIGTRFSTWWIAMATIGAVFEIVYADLLLLGLLKRRSEN
jgi:hypothetical protein